jgi:hypothetical protein
LVRCAKRTKLWPDGLRWMAQGSPVHKLIERVRPARADKDEGAAVRRAM